MIDLDISVGDDKEQIIDELNEALETIKEVRKGIEEDNTSSYKNKHYGYCIGG